MDEVLVAFDERFEELFGKRPKDSSRENHFWQHWDKFVLDRHFVTANKHKDFDRIIALAESYKNMLDIEILTSSGGEKHHDLVSSHKLEWLKKNNLKYPVNIVKSGRLKAYYASPTAILIDDHIDNIQKFRRAGGIGVHHYDIDLTEMYINQLLETEVRGYD